MAASSEARWAAVSTKAGVSRNPVIEKLAATSASASATRSGDVDVSSSRSRRRSAESPFSQALCQSDNRFHRSVLMASLPKLGRQAIVEPGPRGIPVVDHGARGDPERVSRLFDAESTEETHFDHLRGSRVDCRELSERALERDDIDTGIGRDDIETVEWDGCFTRAALR